MSSPFGRPLRGNDWSEALAAPSAPRSVSVVVTHFEQPAQLQRTLHALSRQTHPAHLTEVVVADDGSTLAPEVPAGVKLVRQPDRGFRAAAARNLGVLASTGDIVCMLDADTTPEPEFVARLAAIPSVFPDVAAVGRRRHADFEGVDPSAPVERVAPARGLPEPAWLASAYRDSQGLLVADERSYRFVISAVLACSRWLFDEVGGFDERFDAYGGEDWEWAHRAWLAGAGFAHVPGAVAWHDGPDWAGRNADRRAQKNRETLRLMHMIGGAGGAGGVMLGGSAEAVVRLDDAAAEPAAAAVFADSVLRVVPSARVVLPPHLAAAIPGDPRVSSAWSGARRVDVTVRSPLALARCSSEQLIRAVAAVGIGDLARIHIGDAIEVEATRAAAREQRWGRDVGWRTERWSIEHRAALAEPVDLEGYLGGWWPPAEKPRIPSARWPSRHLPR